ncbi:hypothetical protein HY389_01790 [Candidatus Daviesbacteria bacterium]|nr:hypothetical protein [Candidatus Daviesbacteria bacterium]
MNLIEKLAARLPLPKKSKEVEYFLALDIAPSNITAAVWEVAGNTIDILGQDTLGYSDTEDLLVKANQALDKAIGVLEIEPTKILFGVPDSWLMDENLKEAYSKLLRRMVKEYDLEPMAYVATSHAISHYLQKKEGAPPTAILVGVEGGMVTITLVKAGKVVGSAVSKRADQLFENIETSLNQFNGTEVLPSKILLYSSTEGKEKLDRLKEELVSTPWMQKLSFLHLPKIEVLEENVAISSVVLAGAVEINPDVNFKVADLDLAKPSRIKRLVPEPEIAAGISEAGFVAGDIKRRQPAHKDYEDSDNLMSSGTGSQVSPEDFRREADEKAQLPPVVEKLASLVPAPVVSVVASNIISPTKRLLSHSWFGKARNRPAAISIGILLVLVLAYLFLLRAKVTIYVEPKVLTNDAVVIADPKAKTVDEANKIIPGTVVSTTVSGSGKGSATGQKQIGDPAKGQVVIYNQTYSSQTFSQGTVLTGPNGLKFTLDSSATVASQSAVEGGISFGKTTVSVTASAVGPDSNLPAGTTMTIAGQSSSNFSVKVDTALSGGTSKTITVVTADDQKKLQAQVLDDLKKKASDQLQGQIDGGKKILPDALVTTTSQFNFSKKVNDQAAEFSLDANVSFKGTAYTDADLKQIVSKLVQTNVPDGFELNLDQTETQADISKVDPDGKLYFTARFNAKLFPKLNQDQIKGQIRGDSVTGAVEKFKRMDGVLGADIRFNLPLPNQVARLPLLTQNIQLIITSK